MPVRKLKEFLEQNEVPYKSISHSETYTAQRTAQATDIKGRHMAKTVIVKLDGKMAMVVIHAPYHVDLERLKEFTGASSAELAGEEEFAAQFPGCEVGAMPPFGNLYEMPVYVQEQVSEVEDLAFNAGTHTEVIQMAYKDFERLAKPKTGHFAIPVE